MDPTTKRQILANKKTAQDKPSQSGDFGKQGSKYLKQEDHILGKAS